MQDKSPKRGRLINSPEYILSQVVNDATGLGQTGETVVGSRVDAVSLYVTNSVDPHAVAAFQQTIARLLTEDVATLYMAQLAHNAASDSVAGAGLGHLTMLHDYGVALAWEFGPSLQDPDVVTVTPMACLSV
jgi:hypothetical protein